MCVWTRIESTCCKRVTHGLGPFNRSLIHRASPRIASQSRKGPLPTRSIPCAGACVILSHSGALLHNNEKFVKMFAMEQGTNAAERIIRRFGGQSALAALLGKRQSTVEHWARTGRVPAQWQRPLMSLGRQRGVILDARDFVELKPN